MNATPGNSTYPDVDASRKVSIVMYAVLGSVGIFGNVLVLLVMISFKELRTTTNAFIVNQSVIDMLTSILLFAMFIAPPLPVPDRRSAAEFICAIWNSGYIFWATCIASTFNLVLLTLERYCAVVFPVFYRNRFNNRSTAVLAAIPWIIGFVFQTYWAAVNRHTNGKCIVRYPTSKLQAVAGSMAFLLTFLLPLIFMVFAYMSIEIKLRQRVNKVARGRPTLNACQLPNHLANQRERVRVNVIKTLVIVSVTYAVCWSPNQIAYLCYNYGVKVDLENGHFYHFTVYLAFCNMCINPFIYTFKYRRFREGLKKLFGSRRRSESSSSNTASNIHDISG